MSFYPQSSGFTSVLETGSICVGPRSPGRMGQSCGGRRDGRPVPRSSGQAASATDYSGTPHPESLSGNLGTAFQNWRTLVFSGFVFDFLRVIPPARCTPTLLSDFAVPKETGRRPPPALPGVSPSVPFPGVPVCPRCPSGVLRNPLSSPGPCPSSVSVPWN